MAAQMARQSGTFSKAAMLRHLLRHQQLPRDHHRLRRRCRVTEFSARSSTDARTTVLSATCRQWRQCWAAARSRMARPRGTVCVLILSTHGRPLLLATARSCSLPLWLTAKMIVRRAMARVLPLSCRGACRATAWRRSRARPSALLAALAEREEFVIEHCSCDVPYDALLGALLCAREILPSHGTRSCRPG